MECSSWGARVKQFSVDELVALVCGFGVLLGWFFLLFEVEDVGMYVFDKKVWGMEFSEVVDLVFGIDDINEFYCRVLLVWVAGVVGLID